MSFVTCPLSHKTIFGLVYHHAEMLKSEEKKAYKIRKAMAKHNIDLDLEPKPIGEEDSE